MLGQRYTMGQIICHNSLILPHLQYCVLSWSFQSDKTIYTTKRAVRIITCSKYNAHIEPLLETLKMLEDIMKTKHWNYIIDTNEMNFPMNFKNILIQRSLFQKLLIHMILDINLFYINYQQSSGWLCIRHYIPELLTKTPKCIIIEKLDTRSFSGVSNHMRNHYIQSCNENCLIENCYICQK